MYQVAINNNTGFTMDNIPISIFQLLSNIYYNGLTNTDIMLEVEDDKINNLIHEFNLYEEQHHIIFTLERHEDTKLYFLFLRGNEREVIVEQQTTPPTTTNPAA